MKTYYGQNLSEILNEDLIQKLKTEIKNKKFGSLKFEDAMNFFLTDGIIPQSNLDPKIFLRLEDWAREHSSKIVEFTATDLKNKTGVVIDSALKGHTVHIIKHGRAIVEIKGI
jgi:hypothetical protein